MNKVLLKFCILMFSIITIAHTQAQDTEFWFAAPDFASVLNGKNWDIPARMVISNQSKIQAAQVTLDVYGGNTTPTSYNYTIPAGGSVIHSWTTRAQVTTVENPIGLAGKVANYGIHLTSVGAKVLVYYQVEGASNGELMSLKGKPALGTSFYTPFQHDSRYEQYTPTVASRNNYDQIDIVASEDNTVISFNLTKSCVNWAAGNYSNAVTLNKGQTFKLRESQKSNSAGTLAGTHIESTKPIAVSVLQDYIGLTAGNSGHDAMADQLVPINSLGKSYVVVRGFTATNNLTTSLTDRVYFLGTEDGTTLKIEYYNASNVIQTTTLNVNAGTSAVFDMGKTGSQISAAIHVEASSPIYCYHQSGYGAEEGAALIPSMYSIGQQALSFYQRNSTYNAIALVFKANCENYFTATVGGVDYPLTVTPNNIAGVSDWKWARVDLPNTYNAQLVKISNTESVFSLGYFNSPGGTANYGYLSGFGSFDFGADTIYKCTNGSTTLTGGYAKSYSWIYTPDSINGPYTTLSETTSSITVDKDGFYAILMNQDPNIISDTIFIRTMNFDAKVQPLVSLKDTTSLLSVAINPILTSDPKIEFTYDWTFEGATTTSSTSATPVVTWTGIHRKATVHVTAEATTSNGATVVCDTTINALFVNIEIEPVNKWPESEDGKPVWNPQFDKDNKCSWYGGCDMKFTMTLYPSLEDHDINLRYLGALKKHFIIDSNGDSLKDSYTMLQGDSLLILYFSMTEDSITDANVGKLGAMEAEVVSYGRDTSDWFNLYTNPEYENIYVKPNLRSDKTVDFGITGGSPNLMRSINGRAWRNAYSALTAAEQLCLTDSAVIWLREPNGCWEAQLFFMSGIDPIITRYVNIPKTDGVTTVPEAGKHYVEGHDDFSFTASYAGGSPLKVMANGYYSGIYKELIGQNMDNGTYKYTVVQVTEPWNITFGPELASGTVGNGTIDGTSVWSYKNMLYVNTEAGTIVRIYNMSGSLCKQFTASGSCICGESLQSGVYVVAVGDVRYKVVIN